MACVVLTINPDDLVYQSVFMRMAAFPIEDTSVIGTALAPTWIAHRIADQVGDRVFITYSPVRSTAFVEPLVRPPILFGPPPRRWPARMKNVKFCSTAIHLDAQFRIEAPRRMPAAGKFRLHPAGALQQGN